jgi:hypothetical protein
MSETRERREEARGATRNTITLGEGPSKIRHLRFRSVARSLVLRKFRICRLKETGSSLILPGLQGMLLIEAFLAYHRKKRVDREVRCEMAKSWPDSFLAASRD